MSGLGGEINGRVQAQLMWTDPPVAKAQKP